MTYRQKIWCDRWLARPLAIGANLAARLLGALLHRDHGMEPAQVRVAVVAKLVGMGSILQAGPLLAGLRERFPHCKVVFVTGAVNRELARRLPEIDEVLTLDDRGAVAMALSLPRLVARLIALRADLYFDLEIYSAFASLLALAAVTRNRLGFYRGSTSFKRGIYTHLVFFSTHAPVRELYAQLGRAAGAEPAQPRPPRLSREDRAEAAAALQPAGERAAWPLIVVNPNASALLLERRWPASAFAASLEALAAPGGRLLVLTGSGSEQAYVTALESRLSPATRAVTLNLAGKISLGGLLALLERAACLLTNDTGPMHMGAAMRRPLVALFGPCAPRHYGHISPQIENLYRPVLCSPCVHESDRPPCRGNNLCMQLLDPAEVVPAVERRLRNAAPAAPAPPTPAVRDAEGEPLGVVART